MSKKRERGKVIGGSEPYISGTTPDEFPEGEIIKGGQHREPAPRIEPIGLPIRVFEPPANFGGSLEELFEEVNFRLWLTMATSPIWPSHSAS